MYALDELLLIIVPYIKIHSAFFVNTNVKEAKKGNILELTVKHYLFVNDFSSFVIVKRHIRKNTFQITYLTVILVMYFQFQSHLSFNSCNLSS